MKELLLSPEAMRDLEQTWEFIAQKNIDAADRWQAQIYQTLKLLCKTPGLGKVRREFSIVLRSFYKANHVIFYFFSEETLFVVRILHHSRDAFTVIEKQISEDLADNEQKPSS
jgi:toxin ParE1/3/4